MKEHAPAETEAPRASLPNIHTTMAWRLLRKFIKEQESNDAMPSDIRTVFYTQDPGVLMEYTLCANPGLAALARSRIAHEGESLGLTASTGTILVEDASETTEENGDTSESTKG